MNGAVGIALDNPISASVAAPAQIRKALAVVAFHIRAPMLAAGRRRAPHIEIVIAGHDRDLRRLAERMQEGAGVEEFRRQRDVDEIAGERDLVRRLRLQVGDQIGQGLHAVDRLAPPMPVEEAERALARELAHAGAGQGADMRIGKVRENGHPPTL